MLNNQQITVNGHLWGKVEHLCCRLGDRFGARFGVWLEEDGHLQPVTVENDSLITRVQSELQVWLESDNRAKQFDVKSLSSEGELVVYIQPLAAGQRILIAGIPKLSKMAAMAQLAESVASEVEQSQQVGDMRASSLEYIDQITLDFEELVWMRQVTETLHHRDLRAKSAELSGSIMPALRELIGAEYIALLTAELETDGAPLHVEYELGKRYWQRDESVGLVQEFAADRTGPIIRNLSPNAHANPARPGLRNLILSPIQHSGVHFGWLLAANRIISSDDSDQTYINASCLSNWEFGTFEMGAIRTTAVVLANHLHNARLYQDQEELMLGVVRALINAVDAKDTYTCGHSERVAELSRRIARNMGCDATQCQQTYMAGLLHDLGKIGVPDQVLTKVGPLTDDEYDIIKKHPSIGYAILRHVRQLQDVLPGVLHHHEAYDGSGYPQGLEGDNIPLQGRIIAVADAYDAITSTRSYRAARGHQQAIQILREGAGKQWDAEVVQAFIEGTANGMTRLPLPAAMVPFRPGLPIQEASPLQRLDATMAIMQNL